MNLQTNDNELVVYVVYLEDGILLDKGPYRSWREIQSKYAAYKTSLGPWKEAELLSFFRDDCGEDDSRWPFSRTTIHDFLKSNVRSIRL